MVLFQTAGVSGQTPVLTVQSRTGRTPLVQGVSVSGDQPTQFIQSHTGLTPVMQGMAVSKDQSAEIVAPTPPSGAGPNQNLEIQSVPAHVHIADHKQSPVCKVRAICNCLMCYFRIGPVSVKKFCRIMSPFGKVENVVYRWCKTERHYLLKQLGIPYYLPDSGCPGYNNEFQFIMI